MKKQIFFSIPVLLICVMCVSYSLIKNKRRNICMNNMRIMYNQIKIYMQDHDDSFPNVYAWQRKAPLRGKEYKQLSCPEVVAESSITNNMSGYALNGVLAIQKIDPVLDQVPAKGSDVVFPSTTVLVCEQHPGIAMAGAPNPWIYAPRAKHDLAAEHACERHGGGSFYLFCDGHVKWLRPTEVDGQAKGNNGTRPSFGIKPKR